MFHPSKTTLAKQPDLTIVIPAYREERRIGRTLDELARFLSRDTFFHTKQVEVLVVAADAPDKTAAIVLGKEKLFRDCRLLRPGSRVGKGRDVQYGMLRAAGKVVLFMDADLATPLHHIREFYEACTEGYDVVVGARNLRTYRRSMVRGVFASLGNAFYRLVTGSDITDTQCGFKMFTAPAAQLCFSRQTLLGWGFDIEILAIAKTNGLRLKACRLDDWQPMPFSTYTDGMLVIAGRMIRDFVTVTVNRLRGVYRSSGA